MFCLVAAAAASGVVVMHIPDGLVPPLWCGLGYAGSGGLLWWSCRRLQRATVDPLAIVPRLALLTTAFFTASAVYIPLPPASVHLMFLGSLGILLGEGAMIAVVVGLFLQAVMFGHGGLTTLGLNALIMGIPALLAAAVFRGLWHRCPPRGRSLLGFILGAGAVLLAVLLFGAVILLSLPAPLDQQREWLAIAAIGIAHLPLAMLEGVVTASLLVFLAKVKPEFLSQGVCFSRENSPYPTADPR
ncbi:cobalt transporter CbiM [Thermosynechococcus sp. JY1334]|uniref:cobalt transporter CbiM n=2 Tax=Thermosynechococcus TaxID=146785 RepID=UPI0026738013|nr:MULTISPECIES: cobalt transporter CbiM [unclassified Thermosynechococcus]MDR7898999.1 cobalt transporter CbiM [Thermosynechococcus sp. JY1332]MDR7906404.1 cobalt transporter CbiM [Thermosynechococcus sp. JY1334]WKT82951.1 cobalt transporter CbiM [Thermosynechococcus sp. HY596]WKT86122.1 cobalt transporter CbiM [Thermosynechococcus sp. JY1339]WNC55067.1 cobalt transporter CbiM [Thermosynechococcus sp. JY1331]